MSADSPAGVIHDIGYQRYTGPRLGRLQIGRALYLQSLRAAFGLGRGPKAKIVPWLTFIVMCAPAIVNAVAMAIHPGQTRLVNYDTYINALRPVLMLIFIAAQAPELVSRDLRSRVLPLYFARPIRRLDYPLAKYAAFVTACLAMIEIPLLLLYLGTVLQVHGGSAVWAQTRAFIPGLLVGLMWSVLLAAIGLVLASLTGRRAFAAGAVAIFLFLTYTLARLLMQVGSPDGQPATGAGRLLGLISPYTVLDGVRQWLGGTNPGIVPNPGGYGAAYGIMLLVFLGVSLVGFMIRYARMDVG